jgi:hypothetical protein
MAEGDARKGAASNGTKRAAAMLGCGAAAYRGELDDDNQFEAHEEPPHSAQQQPSPARAPQAPPRARLTGKQAAAISAIGRKLGLDHTGLRAVSKQRYGVVPDHLTKAQASEFIGSLSAQVNGNGDIDDAQDSDGMGA